MRVLLDENLDRRMKSRFTAVTLETFSATDRGEDLVRCEDLQDLFEKLEI